MSQQILVINMMYIGDILFSTPLLHVLRRQYPQAEITMLVDANAAPVIRYNKNLSDLIVIDKRGADRGLMNALRLIRRIRERHFDIVINLHPNERSSAAAAFSGGGKIVGYAAGGFGRFFDVCVPERKDIHQADAYLSILQALGITDFANNGLELWLDKESEEKADASWEGISWPVVGINTGGSWPTKRWTEQGFAMLADQLLERDVGVAFFGGPMDKPQVESILSLMRQSEHPRLRIFTGQTGLLTAAALIKKCSLLVSGDSGPMHIAVAQKVTVVAIFGPSDDKRYYPYQFDSVIFVADVPCRPCGKHSCNRDHICMTSIPVADVLIVAINLLEKKGIINE